MARGLFLRPRYRMLGLGSLPHFLFFEFLSPRHRAHGGVRDDRVVAPRRPLARLPARIHARCLRRRRPPLLGRRRDGPARREAAPVESRDSPRRWDSRWCRGSATHSVQTFQFLGLVDLARRKKDWGAQRRRGIGADAQVTSTKASGRRRRIRVALVVASVLLIAVAVAVAAFAAVGRSSRSKPAFATTKVDGLELPARVQDQALAVATKEGWEPRFWPGVNLGSTIPGRSPARSPPPEPTTTAGSPGSPNSAREWSASTRSCARRSTRPSRIQPSATPSRRCSSSTASGSRRRSCSPTGTPRTRR